MGRWERSKLLASASWRTLRHDKELLVLPLISGIASIAIAATFLVPVLLTSKATDAAGDTTLQPGPLQYVLLFGMYIVLAYVAIFFKAAVLCGADERMRGGDPTIGSALSGAAQRAGKVLPWAIVSATVSVVLRSLEDRAGIVGRIVIGVVGMAWAAVTFLVLPILVFENIGVGDAIKRSTQMLRQTWGENLIVNMGIGLISFLLCIPAFVILAAGAATGTVLGFGTTVVIAVVWLIVVTCWSSAMSAVFQLALYRYATGGSVPTEFGPVDFAHAFAPKTRQRRLGL